MRLRDLYDIVRLRCHGDALNHILSPGDLQVVFKRVTREGHMNCLVSPYYEEGRGTVIDWVPLNEDDE